MATDISRMPAPDEYDAPRKGNLQALMGHHQPPEPRASGVWDAAPLEAALLVDADRQVGGDAAWLSIDDTALPKKGRHSVGVAPQYAAALGKNAYCQTLMSLTLASGEVPVMVGLRLFLPESWTSDPARRERAGVPDDHRAYRTKPGIALAEIDRVRAAGARFAAVRVRVADGPPQRIRDMGAQHLPGEKVWVIGEHRSTGERKYYLSNLPADTPLKQLAGAIKARWVCEQAHQQLKEELGLDHFEGRSWTGLHRHALMTMIAHAFLQSRRLRKAPGGKKNPRSASATKPARHPSGHPHRARAAATRPLPALPQDAHS